MFPVSTACQGIDFVNEQHTFDSDGSGRFGGQGRFPLLRFLRRTPKQPNNLLFRFADVFSFEGFPCRCKEQHTQIVTTFVQFKSTRSCQQRLACSRWPIKQNGFGLVRIQPWHQYRMDEGVLERLFRNGVPNQILEIDWMWVGLQVDAGDVFAIGIDGGPCGRGGRGG